jgi:hypothetical protein
MVGKMVDLVKKMKESIERTLAKLDLDLLQALVVERFY